MAIRTGSAQWDGTIREGSGTVSAESGAVQGKQYSFSSRFEEGTGTNPEELIGAAHAGCFSMAFAGDLERAGHKPEQINTEAKVHVNRQGDGFAITKIELLSRVRAPGIDETTFQEVARKSKEGCPVSQALKAVEITLDAQLQS